MKYLRNKVNFYLNYICLLVYTVYKNLILQKIIIDLIINIYIITIILTILFIIYNTIHISLNRYFYMPNFVFISISKINSLKIFHKYMLISYILSNTINFAKYFF